MDNIDDQQVVDDGGDAKKNRQGHFQTNFTGRTS